MSVACYCNNRSVMVFTGSKCKPCIFWTSLLGAFQVNISKRFQKLIKRGEFNSCHFSVNLLLLRRCGTDSRIPVRHREGAAADPVRVSGAISLCVWNIHARRGKCCSRHGNSRRHYAKSINAWLSFIISAPWILQRHGISTAFHWPHQFNCLWLVQHSPGFAHWVPQ